MHSTSSVTWPSSSNVGHNLNTPPLTYRVNARRFEVEDFARGGSRNAFSHRLGSRLVLPQEDELVVTVLVKRWFQLSQAKTALTEELNNLLRLGDLVGKASKPIKPVVHN